MKNVSLVILSIISIACAGYTFFNQTGHIPMITMYLSGFALAIFLNRLIGKYLLTNKVFTFFTC